MVQPYKFPADAHLLFQMSPPIKLEDLPVEDLEIFQSGAINDNLGNLSRKSLEYLEQEQKKEDKRYLPSPAKKVMDYGIDSLSRGWDAMRDRAVTSGKFAGEGLEKLFKSPIDAEGDVDILPQIKGMGQAGLGTLGVLTSPGAGIAETLHPPEMPQEEVSDTELFGMSYGELRDPSKYLTEMLIPIPKTKGKAPKFKPDEDLVRMLGGSVTAEEKRFIDVFTRAALARGKRPNNEQIVEMVNVRWPKRLGEDYVDAFDPSPIQGFTKGEMLTLKATDSELEKMLYLAQELKNSGFGTDTFFASSLGLSKIPKGARIKHNQTWLEAFASFRATMMTSGIMTSVRNAEVTAHYFLIDAVDRALRSVMRKGLNYKTITTDELGASFAYLNDVLRSVNPANMLKGSGAKITQILRANREAVENSMALTRKSHEVKLPNRVMAVASVLNNMQEYFFRRIAIEASLRNALRARGKNFDTIHPKDISKKELQDAFENGFRMTMAKSGKKEIDETSRQLNKGMLDHIETGQLGALFKLFAMPFPRFVFRNMLPFMRDFSTFGYLKAVQPKVLHKLVHGDPEEFATHASKAMIGSVLLGFGMAMRGSEQMSTYPVDPTNPNSKRLRSKYYQWVRQDASGKYYSIDLRVISPTVGPYLYLAEQFLHPKNVTRNDLLELTLGLRRWGSFALSGFYETMQAYDGDKDKLWGKSLGKGVGEFIGSFAPKILDSLVDIAAGRGIVPPEMAAFRSDAAPINESTKENFSNQMYATFLRNIPYYKTYAPLKHDPLDPTKGRLRDEILADKGPLSKVTSAVIKQFSGLRIEYISPLRAEFDRLGLKHPYGGSRTGVKVFDNMANELIARSVTSKDGLMDQIKDPKYRGLTREKQLEFISEHIYGNKNRRGGVAYDAYKEILFGENGVAKKAFIDDDPRAINMFWKVMSAQTTAFNKRGTKETILESMGEDLGISKQNVLGTLLNEGGR